MAKDWTDFLKPIVPENRLADVLHVAFEGKSSSYLLSAHDLRNAWMRLLESERAEAERIRLAQPKHLPIGYRCARCHDTKVEIVWDDSGRKLGARMGVLCRHHPLQPGEWLYREEERLNELARQAEAAREPANVRADNVIDFQI